MKIQAPITVVARTVVFEIDENTTGETLKQEFIEMVKQGGLEFDFCLDGEILYTNWTKLDEDFSVNEPLEESSIDRKHIDQIKEWSDEIYG